MNTTAFVYKWTHIPTGKWYIGSRTKKGCSPTDGYICSSRTIKPMIVENQTEWVRTILCIGHPEDMLALEARYLTVLDAKHDPMSFNMHNGDGKFTTAGKTAWNKGIKRPTGRVAWNRGLNKNNNEVMAKVSEKRQAQPAHNKGKPMSDEQKVKMSIAMTGKVSPKKGKPGPKQTAEANAKRAEALKGRVSPNKGRTHVASEERKEKIRAALLAYHANKKGA